MLMTDTHEIYQAAFDRQQAHEAPAWLATLRQQAFDDFLRLGWPTPDDEEWRFSSVKPIVETPFDLPETVLPDRTRLVAWSELIAPHRLPGAIELVFRDGHYLPDLSARRALPAGVCVMSLSEALRCDTEAVQSHLARHAPTQDDPFTALNTAFLRDGAYLHLAAGAQLDAPVHLITLSSTGLRPIVSHPRVLIIAEARSRATVIESYIPENPTPARGADSLYWSNAVTEALVDQDADLQHYMLEQDADTALNIETLHVVQAASSRFASHTALFGGALVRNNVHVELAGDDCQSLVNGLFVARGAQHMDNHMRIVHAGLRGDSRQFYKGILDQHAHGVFTGRILVRPGAQKTDAKQTNRNLLLSDDAQIDTRPQLEIYADDVKCTHGATTGRLDQNAAFYLESRGLSPEAARTLLIYAFARESLQRMTLTPVRQRLERLLLAKLPQPELLGHLIDLDDEAADLPASSQPAPKNP